MTERIKSHLKTYKMKLTTLSPIFIGGGESILNIKDEQDFREKILKNNPKKMEEWIDYFINFDKYKHSYDNRIPREANKPSVSGFLRFINDKTFVPNKKTNEFCISCEKGFIPGSSIKGSIVTALQAKEIKERKFDADNFKRQMRGLQISDSMLIPKKYFKEYAIEPQKIIDNKTLGYSSTKYKPKKEFLKPLLSLSIIITIDKIFCKYKIEDIIEAINKFYLSVYNENELALKDTETSVCLNGNTPNINIGGQSGFNTKVTLRAETNSEFEYIQLKKNQLSKNFKKHNHEFVKTAPRYLKTVCLDNEERISIGWCNLQMVEEIC